MNNLDKNPDCLKTVDTNKADYDIYSVPGEVYIVKGSFPEAVKNDKTNQVPSMKPFYSELPDKATDEITFFGYRDQPDASFTLVFGDGPEDVSFILSVEQAKLVINAGGTTTIDLPEDFAIGLRFTLNGVSVSLVDTYSETNPVIALEACIPYRSIPTGISHMAIFTDCASVKFEMINIMFYNQDTEEVNSKRVSDIADMQFLNPSKYDVYVTMFPNPWWGQFPLPGSNDNGLPNAIYTAVYNYYASELCIYGTKYCTKNDLSFCRAYFECYIVWAVRKEI